MIQKRSSQMVRSVFFSLFFVTGGRFLSGRQNCSHRRPESSFGSGCDGRWFLLKGYSAQTSLRLTSATKRTSKKNEGDQDGDILMMECNIHMCIYIYIYLIQPGIEWPNRFLSWLSCHSNRPPLHHFIVVQIKVMLHEWRGKSMYCNHFPTHVIVLSTRPLRIQGIV